MAGSYEMEEKPRVVASEGRYTYMRDERRGGGRRLSGDISLCANGRDLYRPEHAILEPNA